MKSGFKDPIAIKKQHPKDHPEGYNAKNWWDFTCPQYDQRSSNFVNAGTHYGIGHTQPIGHEGNPKQHVDVMPMTRKSNTMRDDEKG
jgi:hypothetical protein